LYTKTLVVIIIVVVCQVPNHCESKKYEYRESLIPSQSSRSRQKPPLNPQTPSHPFPSHPSHTFIKTNALVPLYLRIGIPSLTSGGLMLSLPLSPIPSPFSASSMLVSRFKKLLSLTGLPLCATPPICILLFPLPP